MSSSDEENNIDVLYPQYNNLNITSPERTRFQQLAKSKLQVHSENVEEFSNEEEYEIGTFIEPESVYNNYYLPIHHAQAEHEFEIPSSSKWVAHYIQGRKKIKKRAEKNLSGFIEEDEQEEEKQKKITCALMPKFIIFSTRTKSKNVGWRAGTKDTDLHMFANNDYSCIEYILQ